MDPNNILSRNWMLGQMAGVGGYFRDALSGEEGWLRKFWSRAFYLVRSNGKFVLSFATGPEDWRILGVLLVGYRKVVSPGSQIMTIAGGTGSLGETAKAAWSASRDSVMRGAGMALAFSMAVDTMIWFNDYREGKKDFYDLFVALGIDVVKAGLVAGATSVTVSGLIAAFAAAFGSASVTVLSVAIGTVLITVVVAYAVDWMFNELHINDWLTKVIREAGKAYEQSLPRDYGNSYTISNWTLVP